MNCFFKKNHYICVSLSLRNEAGGLALSPCQKQHQEVWMGEKGKDNEAALNMNKDALTLRNPYRAQVHLFAQSPVCHTRVCTVHFLGVPWHGMEQLGQV